MSRSSSRRARGGPPLGPVIGISLALFVASLVVPLLVTGQSYPSPRGPATDLADYIAEHPAGLRLSALFLFASSVPLLVFGAAAASQLRRLRVRVAGPLIGMCGAVVASASLALTGLLQWTLSRVAADASALQVALRDLAFITGGPWHTVGLGLLVAGIAVPAWFLRLLPRPLAATGIGLAVICELTTLAIVLDPAAYAIPVGRLGGLLWLLAAGILLPVRPHARNRS